MRLDIMSDLPVLEEQFPNTPSSKSVRGRCGSTRSQTNCTGVAEDRAATASGGRPSKTPKSATTPIARARYDPVARVRQRPQMTA